MKDEAGEEKTTAQRGRGNKRADEAGPRPLLGRRELGNGLRALRDRVFRHFIEQHLVSILQRRKRVRREELTFSGQDEADRGLDLARRDGRLLVLWSSRAVGQLPNTKAISSRRARPT